MKAILKYIIATTIILVALLVCGCNKDNSEPEVNKSVWAVGTKDANNYGTIYYSENGGQLWEKQGEGQAALLGIDLNDVWAVDENTVWIVGSPSTVIKTNNGGVTWEVVATPQQKNIIEYVSISIVGSSDIWISGSFGTLLHSGDAGVTWKNVDYDVLTSKYLQGVNAITQDHIYVVGGNESSDSGFVAYTRNGGDSWHTLIPDDDFNKNRWIGCASSDNDNIIIYGGHSHYMLSQDAGYTWKNDSVSGTGGTGGADINCLKMLSSNTWWGAFDYDYIGRTENTGETWHKQTAAGPQGMWLLGIDYYNNNIGVIVGESSMSQKGKILNTIDGGETWILSDTTDVHMVKVSFIK